MGRKKVFVTLLLSLLLLHSIPARADGDANPDPGTEPENRSLDDQDGGAPPPPAPDNGGAASLPKAPHHHEKPPKDSSTGHPRSPVYEVVNQPCYSPKCGGVYGGGPVPGGYPQGRPRYGPYPGYAPRRRGGFGGRARGGAGGPYYPSPGYGPVYYPEAEFAPRGAPYPQGGYDRWRGGYGVRPQQPYYDEYFFEYL